MPIRMTEGEYQVLQNMANASGRTIQGVVIDAIMNGRISSTEEIQALREINIQLADMNRQIKGVANNLNQLAHGMNLLCSVLQDNTPDAFRIRKIVDSLMQCNWSEIFQQIKEYRRESDAIWLSLRRFVAQQKIRPDSGTASNTHSETVRLEKDM